MGLQVFLCEYIAAENEKAAPLGSDAVNLCEINKLLDDQFVPCNLKETGSVYHTETACPF